MEIIKINLEKQNDLDIRRIISNLDNENYLLEITKGSTNIPNKYKLSEKVYGFDVIWK